MSDAFEEYHVVKGPRDELQVVFMAWGSYFCPETKMLMKGPMIRLEIHPFCEEFNRRIESPLSTGETWKRYHDREQQPKMMEEWLKRERI